MPTAPGFANMSVQFVLTGLNRPAYITFGVQPSATDPQAVATAVYNSCIAAGSLMSRMDNSVTLSQVRASLGTDGGEDIVGQITGTQVGAISGGAPPANVAVLVHKVTTRGGRRGRGRLFLPWWVPETDIDEAGLIDAPDVSTLQAAASVFLGLLATNNVPMFLLHDAGKTAPGAPNAVTALTVDRLIGTQRRRLGR